jgi:hypothetical protein
LDLAKCRKLDALLTQADGPGRRTTTLTATYHQPNRLRITQVEAPDYELRAAAQYVRGDVLRVQGKERVSCGLDVSARFGVPLLREQLAEAMTKAREYVEFRVPSRKRDIVEFIPDSELKRLARADDTELLAKASMWAAGRVLPPEDFSDWEN